MFPCECVYVSITSSHSSSSSSISSICTSFILFDFDLENAFKIDALSPDCLLVGLFRSCKHCSNICKKSWKACFQTNTKDETKSILQNN